MPNPEARITSIKNYQTNPSHPLDVIWKRIIYPVDQRFTDGKASCGLHWIDIPLPHELPEEIIKRQLITGDLEALRKRSLLDEFKMHYGAWKTARILTPDIDVDNWQYAFAIPGSETMRLCRYVFEGPESVRMLVGPDSHLALGFTRKPDGNLEAIPLNIGNRIPRSERRDLILV